MKRLRHVDRQVRLATLLGLQSTLLVSKTAFNNNIVNNNKNNNMDILQAIREQIMDHATKNLECAIAASECIVQYLKNKNWDENSNSSSEDDDDNSDSSIIASWSIIFIGRLEQCFNAIQQIQNNQPQLPQQSQAQQQQQHQLAHWYALTVPCAN